MNKTALFPLLASLLWISGCGGGDGTTKAGRQELFLYCGAGLRSPVQDLVAEFKEVHGLKVVTDYAGSETLLNRIELSRHGDLYMPGDKYYVSMAADKGVVAEQTSVCYFVPTILVRNGYEKTEINDLEDLLDKNVKLGIGGDACAIGRKTKKIFEKNGISRKELEDNVSFHALTVNELGNHIETGSLDAVIVWDAVAALYPESGYTVEIPSEKNIISTVDVGLLSCSRSSESARTFMEFAASEQGKKIFAAHNYTVEKPR
ncbi:MAG: substrate-binding domain-containing protein [Planctomycetota bacterium]